MQLSNPSNKSNTFLNFSFCLEFSLTEMSWNTFSQKKNWDYFFVSFLGFHKLNFLSVPVDLCFNFAFSSEVACSDINFVSIFLWSWFLKQGLNFNAVQRSMWSFSQFHRVSYHFHPQLLRQLGLVNWLNGPFLELTPLQCKWTKTRWFDFLFDDQSQDTDLRFTANTRAKIVGQYVSMKSKWRRNENLLLNVVGQYYASLST